MADEPLSPIRSNRGWTPDPDPTVLTTAQSQLLREELYRAIQNVREFLEARLETLDNSVETFHSKMPQDLKDAVDGQHQLFTEKLSGLKDEANQKFAGIALQFTERDVRVEQASVASKTAIDAAFLANQKAADANAESNDKAITKSEAATKEKIDGLQALLTGSINDIRGQIAGLTSRQDRAEGASKGVTDNSFERRGNVGMVVGIAAVSATAISMIVGVVLFVATHVSAPAPAPAPAPLSYAPPTVVSPAVVPVQPK